MKICMMEDYLFVHEDIYDGVVYIAAFSQVNGNGSNDGVDIHTGAHDDCKGHGSIWQPGHEEGQNHHHHHAGHLHLHTNFTSGCRNLQFGHLGDQNPTGRMSL